METRHVRLGYEEALSAKKELLSSELNLLHTLKKLKNYKTLRKKELIEKNKLKTLLNSLKLKINLMQSTFSGQEESHNLKRTKRIKKEKKQSIQEELEDIRKKLEGLR